MGENVREDNSADETPTGATGTVVLPKRRS
jgi:hypothetical protein